jgi:hypothetical protein
MAYKYYTAGSPVFFQTPKQYYSNGFQSWLNDQFYNSSDYYVMQEESSFASGSFIDVDVRVNRAVSSVTGVKLGDDFKQLLFKNIEHATGIGFLYQFDENFWLCTHSETIKNLGITCTVRRCNNMLKWIDDYGNTYSEPCIIDYEIKRPTDSMGRVDPVTPEGFIQVFTQGNTDTRQILPSQRFLFGNTSNRTCYKIYGNGINNFENQKTQIDESANLLWFYMGASYINNETDDLTNGIADRYKVSIALSLYPTSITGNTTETIQLYPTVTLNDIKVYRDVIYSSSSSAIASVSGSGLVTLNSSGSCNILSYVETNISASANALVTVMSGSSTLTEVRVDPNPDFILQDDTTSYNVKLYVDGVQQAETFAFTISGSNVPTDNYTFTTITGNSFSVENIKVYMDNPLVINCVSGSATKQLSILLKGSW